MCDVSVVRHASSGGRLKRDASAAQRSQSFPPSSPGRAGVLGPRPSVDQLQCGQKDLDAAVEAATEEQV